MAKSEFKKNLAKLIKERGISARELSRQTGIAQSTLNNFLAGKSPSNPEQIHALAKFFGTSMEQILFSTDDRPPTLDEVLTEGVFDGWLRVKIERAIPNKKK